MLTRACCCGGDAPTIGCSSSSLPTDPCIIVQLQGVAPSPDAMFYIVDPPVPAEVLGFSGYNTTYLMGSPGQNSFPTTGSARIRCDGGPFDCPEECAEVQFTGAIVNITLVCRADNSIGVRNLDIRAVGARYDCPPIDDPSFDPHSNFIFRRSAGAGSFALNTSIANGLPTATTPYPLGSGGTAIVNVIAGPCSGGMALRSPDPDAVARQIAALQEPLTRQRRASGCRGCGDAGGDALV